MPGIAGRIGSGCLQESQVALDEMVKRMIHEDSHIGGRYHNESLGLCAGWVAHRGSFSDCLPAWNEAKDICLILSGETFVEQTEIENLKSRGHNFEVGDASYLPHLYEELGIQFLERLNGWFSGVLVDLRQGKTVLFNDRYGLGRVYFHETRDGFYFSSEAKSLLGILPGLRELDVRSLAEFCSFGCVLQNRTLFRGISLLPGASRWTFAREQPVKRESYFQKESWENQATLEDEEFQRQLKEVFERILPKYLGNKQRLGMSLTGGLDGRMILAWGGFAPGSLPCYTFGGQHRDCADVKIARRVAEICQQSHRVIPVGCDFLKQFPALAEKTVYISDGAMDVAGSVELYVNRIARKIAPVRLTGNYGSEILRSNVAFQPGCRLNGLFEPGFASLIDAAAKTYAHESRARSLSFIAFKQVPWHHYSRLAVEQSQLTVRSPYLDNDLVQLMYRASEKLTSRNEPFLRLISDGNPALSRVATDRGLAQQPILGITRARRFYHTLTFKADCAYDSGMPQWLARLDHTFAPFRLEKLFLGRHRFYHFRVWYRDELANYVGEMLLDARTRGRSHFHGSFLEEMLKGHFTGKRNYTIEIHKALTLELIQRQLLERTWN